MRIAFENEWLKSEVAKGGSEFSGIEGFELQQLPRKLRIASELLLANTSLDHHYCCIITEVGVKPLPSGLGI